METFKDLELLPKIQRALEAAEYVKPTEIQAKAIPEGLAGRDILGCAQTGTGKPRRSFSRSFTISDRVDKGLSLTIHWHLSFRRLAN